MLFQVIATFVSMFKIQDLRWSTLKWSLPWQCRHEKIKPHQSPGDRQFLKMEKKKTIKEKNPNNIITTEKMAQSKMLSTPPWCLQRGHPGRYKEENWKYSPPHLSTPKAECSGPACFSSQTHALGAEMGALCWAERPCREQHDGSRYNPPSHLQRYEEVGFPGAVSFPPCGNAPLEMRLVSVAVCICT